MTYFLSTFRLKFVDYDVTEKMFVYYKFQSLFITQMSNVFGCPQNKHFFQLSCKPDSLGCKPNSNCFRSAKLCLGTL